MITLLSFLECWLPPADPPSLPLASLPLLSQNGIHGCAGTQAVLELHDATAGGGSIATPQAAERGRYRGYGDISFSSVPVSESPGQFDDSLLLHGSQGSRHSERQGKGKGKGKYINPGTAIRQGSHSGRPPHSTVADFFRPHGSTCRLLIHHELQLQSLQQDCKLHLYLRSGQRSFLPNLHGMATEWSRLRKEEPQKISSPLRVILLQAVLVEMDTRVQLALQKEKQAIIEMKWLTDMDAWTYMRWTAEKSQLELMEDQKPRPHESLLESIAELRTLVTPDSIKKFASLKGIPQGAPVGVDPLPVGAGVPSPGRSHVGATPSTDQQQLPSSSGCPASSDRPGLSGLSNPASRWRLNVCAHKRRRSHSALPLLARRRLARCVLRKMYVCMYVCVCVCWRACVQSFCPKDV